MYLPFYQIPALRVGCDLYSKKNSEKDKTVEQHTHTQFRGSHTLNFLYNFGVYRTS